VSFSDAWREIAKKYEVKPEVSKVLKKLGKPFPYLGAHYYYADLVEHIRHALAHVKVCEVDEIVEYHLPEIYKRLDQLSEELSKAKTLLREDEYNKVYNEISRLSKEWTKDFKRYLHQCFIGARK